MSATFRPERVLQLREQKRKPLDCSSAGKQLGRDSESVRLRLMIAHAVMIGATRTQVIWRVPAVEVAVENFTSAPAIITDNDDCVPARLGKKTLHTGGSRSCRPR